MPLEADPYVTLGVPPSASAGEIRTAWRRTALATHPDRNPGDAAAERRFKAAAAAYELLGDPHRRAAWDAWDAARRSNGAPPPPSGPQVRPREPAPRAARPTRPLHGVAVALYIGLHPRNVAFNVVHGWQLAVLLTGLAGAFVGWL